MNSVKEIHISDRNIYKSISETRQDIEILHKYFPNLTKVDLHLIQQKQLESIVKVEDIIEVTQIPNIHSIESNFIGSKFTNWIDSKNGWILLWVSGNEHFIHYKQLRLDVSKLNWSLQGDYLEIKGPLCGVQFCPETFIKDWKYYEHLDFENIQIPTLFLHKNFIQEYEITSRPWKIKIIPTRKIKLNINETYEHYIRDFIAYFENHEIDKIDVDLKISWIWSSVSDFENTIDIIFDKLRVISLWLSYPREKFYTETFKNRILQCQSLQFVKIQNNRNSSKVLDFVDLSSNIKQWVLEFNYWYKPSNDFQQNIMSMENNNLLVLNHKLCSLLEIPHSNQTFQVHPI